MDWNKEPATAVVQFFSFIPCCSHPEAIKCQNHCLMSDLRIAPRTASTLTKDISKSTPPQKGTNGPFEIFSSVLWFDSGFSQVFLPDKPQNPFTGVSLCIYLQPDLEASSPKFSYSHTHANTHFIAFPTHTLPNLSMTQISTGFPKFVVFSNLSLYLLTIFQHPLHLLKEELTVKFICFQDTFPSASSGFWQQAAHCLLLLPWQRCRWESCCFQKSTQ